MTDYFKNKIDKDYANKPATKIRWDKTLEFMGGGKNIKSALDIGKALISGVINMIWMMIPAPLRALLKGGMKFAGGALGTAKGILGFQKGGQVTGTGLAMVHKGETIIPSGGGNTNNKQINNSITMNVGNIAGVEDDFAASLGPTLMNELGRFTT